ncbi:transposase [Bacillus thuringiensis]|uniref:transposase n=1 Tax=Bacillus thuringiensis TaxID=1428 RepID=UPI003CFF7C14
MRWYSKTGTQYRDKLFYVRGVSDEKKYDEMFKKQCVELIIKEGRTISSIQREFDLGHGTLHSWIQKYSSPLLGVNPASSSKLLFLNFLIIFRCFYVFWLEIQVSEFYDIFSSF